MAHPLGEKLRCEECGAEVVYIKACNCPEREKKVHSHLCCNKEMRSIGVQPSATVPSPRKTENTGKPQSQ